MRRPELVSTKVPRERVILVGVSGPGRGRD
jgi:hypothetical protein